MRAAMYMPGLRPGSTSWTIYQAFAEAIRAQGPEFELVTDVPETDAASVPGTTFLPTGSGGGLLEELAAPFTRDRRFLARVRSLRAYLDSQPDLELLYLELAYPVAAAATIAASLAGWRGATVVTPMGEDVIVVPEASYGFRRHLGPRWLLSRTLSRAAAIRCISPVVTEIIGPWLQRPHAVIPLNVAADTVDAAHRPAEETRRLRDRAREALRRAFGLGDRPIVLSLGRLHPFKGIHVLVDAMAHVPDADLLVVGPSLRVEGFGEYGEYLAGRAAARGVSDRVRLVGGVPHERVLQLLAGADVLVVPSLHESLNRVCVEAAAAGTAFVVTETTGVAAFVTEEGVGLKVPPRDPQAIANAVSAVIEGRWQRDAAAAARFVDRFDAGAIAPQCAELFRRALARD